MWFSSWMSVQQGQKVAAQQSASSTIAFEETMTVVDGKQLELWSRIQSSSSGSAGCLVAGARQSTSTISQCDARNCVAAAIAAVSYCHGIADVSEYQPAQ